MKTRDLNVKTAHPHEQASPATENQRVVFQCTHCFTVYDEAYGDEINDIPPSIQFQDLPEDYSCALCSAPRSDFLPIPESDLIRQHDVSRNKTI
jgi:rubredoxin